MPFVKGTPKPPGSGRKSKNTSPQIRIEYWPATRLVPYARNPRKNDKAVDRIVASIREYGFTVPILARSNGDVIDGHLRLKGALALKMAEVPVIPCDGWSPAQVKAFRLLANRSVNWAEWDMDALALEFGELKALDFDLTLTGFDEAEFCFQDQAGETTESAKQTLAERFGVPPFSVLDARQGYWQDRKRAWMALGIQSELGRGAGGGTPPRHSGGVTNAAGSRKGTAGGGNSPGGSPRPAMKLKNGKTMRGDGRGRALMAEPITA